MAKATNPYRAAGWESPFEFSKSHRQLLPGRVGLSPKCVSRIEDAIKTERTYFDILSREPSAAEVEKALDDGAKAATKLLTWLTRVDSKARSVINNSNIQRTGKKLSHYRPIIKELRDSIWLAKQRKPKIKSGRTATEAMPKFLLRLASLIADEIELDGNKINSSQNGPVCQTFEMALDVIGIERKKTRAIVGKMFDKRPAN